jgi:hypothetical protein
MKALFKALLTLALLCLFATSSNAQISSLRELMPPPKVAYLIPAQDTARIYLPTAILGMANWRAGAPELRVFSRVLDQLRKSFKIQYQLELFELKQFPGDAPAKDTFILGIMGTTREFDSLVNAHLIPGEKLDRPEGYVIHATQSFTLIAGFDTAGLVQGATRFSELWTGGNKYLPAHILDYPDYPNRWAFSMHNMRGANAVNVMKGIIDTMQRYHYNGMQQNDFKYNLLEDQPDFYFRNADTIITYASDRQIAMIPGVAPFGYSEGILWHDRNLAEGFPANTKYVIEADTARLVPDPPVGIANGGFENVNGKGEFTGFGFYDNENGATTADATIKHSGAQSARTIDPIKANPSGNARFSLPIVTKPNKYYYLSAWVRTENVDRGEFRVLAIGTTDGVPNIPLTHTAFNVPSTTDKSKNGGWIKLGVLFNTQHQSKMNIYCGIWGGNTGTIWWDDFKIEEAGFVNLLRRSGTPLVIDNNRGEYLIEGQDFAPLHDSIMLKQGVLYDFHTPPTFHRLASGQLTNGDTINAKFYHAFTTINDVNGYGQNMACPSEPATMQIVQDQITRVRDLHRMPKKYMLGHDEIRHLNWDHSCQSRDLSPAEILGANVTESKGLINTISPGATVFAWSDMFDSLHNAVDNFYAVHGDLRGVWNMIPKDITIMNWNSGKRDASLAFFADHGFAQMSAPYYDQGNTINMREWRIAQEKVPNVSGMMYTTWSADYRFLRPFGYYAWGAGPYIMHRPLDSTLAATADAVIGASIMPDPFDPSDRIVEAKVSYTLKDGTVETANMEQLNAYGWMTVVGKVASYTITAVNSQGIRRTLPTYVYETTGTESVASQPAEAESEVFPNPATSKISISEGRIVRIMSISGAELIVARDNAKLLDVSGLAAGSYIAEIETSNGIKLAKFAKR